MNKKLLLLLTCCLSLFSIVLSAKTKRDFIIASSKVRANISIDNKEDSLVFTALNLFKDDVNKISNNNISVNETIKSDFLIKLGTIGVDPNFDAQCVVNGIDTSYLKSNWESYIIKTIPGKKKGKYALWIVGSQPRGTAYALMELSKYIGVSPWYWWDDVKPEKRETITVPSDLYIQDAPKVKFRGIFLNDEDWGLKPWASKTFEPETGDIGPQTYEKIFELLLRLKANYIWPAMHECTRAFFTYPDNIKMADKYGIWVGSSHCEPMLRNNVDEWHRWNPEEGERGKWNFDVNPDKITEYWSQRVQNGADYDAIYTVGMRGIHDGRMPGGKNKEDKVRILGDVVNAQREILKEKKGEKASSIPQIFCPYKEVLELYRAGANIPEDVTIMWADDNNGYIRQLSNQKERLRSGGAGVYYHISYWGRPHDYLWLESIPVALIWEEMYKAYQTNGKNVWIVNVGDIKPNEIGMNFFLDMAWNPDQFTPENLNSYYEKFASEQFGEQYATEIGSILDKYFQLGFSRKPEHMGWTSVYPNTEISDPELSLYTNGDEVQQRIDAYEDIEQRVEALLKNIPEEKKEAFYQLVAYKVIGASNMNKKLLYAYKSREYAKQQRNSANVYADKAELAFDKIKQSTAYYNDSLADGKWKYMMSYNPRELPVFTMPETGSYQCENKKAGFIQIEGSVLPISSVSDTINMPVFNSATDRSYFIDIINSGVQDLSWSFINDIPWIELTKESGSTNTEERVGLSVDWSKFPDSSSENAIVKLKVNDNSFDLNVTAQKTEFVDQKSNLFLEDNGVVSIETEHYSDIKTNKDKTWKTIAGLGRESDAIGSYPINSLSQDTLKAKESAYVSYDFQTTSSGTSKLYFYCLPNQPVNSDYQLRFAISIDDNEPIIMNAELKAGMNEHNKEWQKNVLSSVTIQQTLIDIQTSGKHNLKVYMIDPGVVLDKVEIVFDDKNPSYLGNRETIVRNK